MTFPLMVSEKINMKRTNLILQSMLLGFVFTGPISLSWASLPKASISTRPNFVVIFCDDLGYGDVTVSLRIGVFR